jgi:hypothetical protein
MRGITVYLDAVGLCGPGLPSWAASRSVLSGCSPYVPSSTEISPSAYLPAAERRRVGTAVKLALATATDALDGSDHDASELLSVFSSSGGDGDNCHTICEALASNDRLISPTRFTNSVHNAPSGYWGIALKARPASTSLCAYDGSFSSGLLEAATQTLSANAAVLLIAYDTPYPEPLHTVRPIASSMGVAMILTPQRTTATLATLHLSLEKAMPTRISDEALESLRINVPAARSLPLLQAVAKSSKGGVEELVLEYFDNQQLCVTVEDVA